MRVAFSYVSFTDRAAEVERAAAADGGAAKAVHADLAEPDAVREFLARSREWLGGFDILVDWAARVPSSSSRRSRRANPGRAASPPTRSRPVPPTPICCVP
ncbi:hypothetical protein GCM10010129_80420 [Streptomyces fumigatiscleroticus]|nr:hypothetical protein GCM10010129_80420 [Streptomyces fumigatiscleroticus]